MQLNEFKQDLIIFIDRIWLLKNALAYQDLWLEKAGIFKQVLKANSSFQGKT
jgi:hypothetical protein